MTSSLSYRVDTTWYANFAATDHMTGNLDKLSMWKKYHGQEWTHTTDGSGMRIIQIVKSMIPTRACNIHINKILHVPSTVIVVLT
jgi:hypothetical protein